MPFRDEFQALIPVLRRFARGLVRDREIADDLVQDTLLRALRAESRWTGGPMKIWLMTILANLNRNRLRSLSRRGVADPLDAADGVTGAPPTTGEARDILRALASLSDDQREVLVAVAVEGLSYGEAAQVFGVPEGTVMSRLSRARSAMRAMLEAGEPGQRTTPHLRVVK